LFMAFICSSVANVEISIDLVFCIPILVCTIISINQHFPMTLMEFKVKSKDLLIALNEFTFDLYLLLKSIHLFINTLKNSIMRKTIMTTIGLTAILSANAQKDLKTTAVNLFKNGTYFIVKEGTVNAPKGSWSMSMENFNPLLSTFWISTLKESPVNRIEFITDTIKSTRAIGNFYDALNANKGKKIRLTYTIGASANSVSNAKGTLENFYPATGMAKIKTQEGSFLFLNTSNIYELFFDQEPNERVKSDSLARVARIVFDKEKNNMPLKISYMQSGMNWAPSYSIKMLDENKLQCLYRNWLR